METISLLQNHVAVLPQDNLFTFVKLCEELAGIAAQQNVHLTPYNEKGLLCFQGLEQPRQEQINQQVQDYIKKLNLAMSEKIVLRGDSRQHVWWSLKNLKLVPPSNLLDHISSDDLVEIYSSDGIQVFRSFELFQHISYSLSEIFTFTWMELFERDELVFKNIFDVVDKVLAGEMKGIINQQLPPYVIKEKFSSERKWIKIQEGILCPLHNMNGSIGGYLYSYRILSYGSDAMINPFIISKDFEI